MTYQFYPNGNNAFHMTKLHSGCRIVYYNKQKMDELYPNNKYEVIGEIGNLAKKYRGQDVIVTDTGTIIHIFPLGSLKKPFEWVTGYAAVGENIYVAVVKSVIPW